MSGAAVSGDWASEPVTLVRVSLLIFFIDFVGQCWCCREEVTFVCGFVMVSSLSWGKVVRGESTEFSCSSSILPSSSVIASPSSSTSASSSFSWQEDRRPGLSKSGKTPRKKVFAVLFPREENLSGCSLYDTRRNDSLVWSDQDARFAGVCPL